MLLRKWMKKKRVPQNRVSLQKTLCTRLLSLIKKKKMQELEKLLNSLIQRGWKPWGIKRFVEVLVSWTTVTFFTEKSVASHTSLRSIVSLESQLWQFVCENDMVYSSSFIEWQKWGKQWVVLGLWSIWHKYRLLESALIPEEELGKFLVENIKVE